MNIEQIDRKIKDTKISGYLLLSQFIDVLVIKASFLERGIIEGSDFLKDVDLHFRMQSQLRKDLVDADAPKSEKENLVENVLNFNTRYLNILEGLLKFAKNHKSDKNNKWLSVFGNLNNCVEYFKNEIAALEEYLQEYKEDRIGSNQYTFSNCYRCNQ